MVLNAKKVVPAPALSPTLTAVFAVACGALVANLYYAQALVGLIGPDLGLRDSLTGLVVESRGRINAVYMTIVFLAGAPGSMLAGFAYFHGGWWLTALTGGGLGMVVLLFFLG